jgi:hypothetical protein
MVDPLVPISLDGVLLILKILRTFDTKQVTLMRRSTVLSLLLQLVFPVVLLKHALLSEGEYQKSLKFYIN